jgi:gamma-tubulin complex component 2
MYVDSTYQHASRNLMVLLKDRFRLKDALLIMKRYFLLDQGDFLMHFLDASEEELGKPIEEVSAGRVQHFLNMSVQSSEAQRECDYDPNVLSTAHHLVPTTLRCRFSHESLVAYLDSLYGGIADQGPRTPSRQAYGASARGNTGFDLFSIDFVKIPFPISLVVSRHAMENYKLLFRHLFFAKHVERRLVAVWSDHQLLKKLDALRGLLGHSFLLRQRMLHFVQNLINYMTFEVVENNWLEMMLAIDGPSNGSPSHKEQTVDDILNIHDDFLQKTLEACLLKNPALITSLTKLLNTCLLFTDQMKRFMDTTRIVSTLMTWIAPKLSFPVLALGHD